MGLPRKSVELLVALASASTIRLSRMTATQHLVCLAAGLKKNVEMRRDVDIIRRGEGHRRHAQEYAHIR
jgi:hypothetical protein